MSIGLHFCDNLSINSLSCRCSKGQKEDDEDFIYHGRIGFTLVNIEQTKFNDFLPANENYIYFKILCDENILTSSIKQFDELPLEESDIVGKKLMDIKKYSELFADYIRPLFLASINNGKSFQFTFHTNLSDRLLSCNLYPCSIPPKIINSCDIVIRYSHHGITGNDISKFILNTGTLTRGSHVDLII